MMNPIKECGKSAERVSGMVRRVAAARAPEIDWTSLLDPGQLRTMTVRCALCSQKDACDTLLTSNDALPTAPDYCRNGDTINAL